MEPSKSQDKQFFSRYEEKKKKELYNRRLLYSVTKSELELKKRREIDYDCKY